MHHFKVRRVRRRKRRCLQLWRAHWQRACRQWALAQSADAWLCRHTLHKALRVLQVRGTQGCDYYYHSRPLAD